MLQNSKRIYQSLVSAVMVVLVITIVDICDGCDIDTIECDVYDNGDVSDGVGNDGAVFAGEGDYDADRDSSESSARCDVCADDDDNGDHVNSIHDAVPTLVGFFTRCEQLQNQQRYYCTKLVH